GGSGSHRAQRGVPAVQAGVDALDDARPARGDVAGELLRARDAGRVAEEAGGAAQARRAGAPAAVVGAVGALLPPLHPPALRPGARALPLPLALGGALGPHQLPAG